MTLLVWWQVTSQLPYDTTTGFIDVLGTDNEEFVQPMVNDKKLKARTLAKAEGQTVTQVFVITETHRHTYRLTEFRRRQR